jgi:hypothetical protein
MTTTPTIPNVPLPAATTEASEWVDSFQWAESDGAARVFYGATRAVLDARGEKIAEIRTSGLQHADGSVDTGRDLPTVDIYIHTDDGLNSARARELAAVLLLAADEMDGWVGTG